MSEKQHWHDAVRKAGGIVHGDGNIFFTDYRQMKSAMAPLEAERDALRASVDQLADTLKNVHEAVCATLGIEGDDSLPELVADWVESNLDVLRADAARYRHMRSSFARDIKHRLTWYLPAMTTMTADGLDSAIDTAIAAKEPK